MVTFNVQHGRPAAPAAPLGRLRRPRLGTDLLARHCRGLGADVLALQEVDVRVARSGWADQAAVVAEATGLEPAFGQARRLCLGRYGNALLGRNGLSDVEVIRLPREGRAEPRVAVLATVAVGAGLSVAATHLSTRRPEAIAQLEAVMAALVARPGPHVLLGDLNLGPDEVQPMVDAAGLTLADPAVPSYPASAPRRRIDHVAVSGLSVEAVEVLPAAPVSDHRPVLAELAQPS